MPTRRCPLAVLLRTAIVAAGLLAATAMQGRADESPDAALAGLLTQAHDAAKCGQPGIDRLVRVLCSGHLRVGVRDYYPLFGIESHGEHKGYEVDVARAIAAKLGVEPEFLKVNAGSRIPLVDSGEIDVAIATMGHNTQRDGQVRFIRPHYYQSETVLVGARDLKVGGWNDVRGRTVCATVGNGSNIELVAHGARLMLFAEAVMLPDRLKDLSCTLAAQDDSFFAYYFTEPDFAAQFAPKFGFSQVPWGMGVARHGSAQLARALDLISQIFHRDGVFLEAARANHIGTAFLQRQHAVWQRPACNDAAGSTNPSCILPPFDATTQSTPIAGEVLGFERWVQSLTGIDLQMPMLKTVPAWSMFVTGVANTLVLIVGAIAATLVFALTLGAAAGSRFRLLRWPVRAVTITLQSTPIVLTLVIVSAVMDAVMPYSSAVALTAAILALGLANGCNAGQAIAEAMVTLRAEREGLPSHALDLFVRALSRSSTQIVAFLINAAKGSPIASFIGAPEILSAMTDISSFSSGRATTYTFLLVFYTAIVIVVIALCRRMERLLERSYAHA